MSAPKVAIYLRVSTSDQSCEMQETELRKFAALKGWTIDRVFSDTATGTNDRRPQLQEMMNAARAKEFDILLIYKLDRLFRSIKGLVTTLHEFDELGLQFVSVTDQINLSTSSGRLMTHIIGAFAEFEASMIRERVRSGLQNARSKGIRLGRPTTIDSKAVIQLRANGLSIAAIARHLNCSKAGVHKILQAI